MTCVVQVGLISWIGVVETTPDGVVGIVRAAWAVGRGVHKEGTDCVMVVEVSTVSGGPGGTHCDENLRFYRRTD